MPTLHVHDGAVSVEIADPKGEVRLYGVEPVDPASVGPWCRWAVRLARVDTGKVYLVTLNARGGLACECPAFKFGRGHPCKHTGEIGKVIEVLRLLGSAPRKERVTA